MGMYQPWFPSVFPQDRVPSRNKKRIAKQTNTIQAVKYDHRKVGNQCYSWKPLYIWNNGTHKAGIREGSLTNIIRLEITQVTKTETFLLGNFFSKSQLLKFEIWEWIYSLSKNGFLLCSVPTCSYLLTSVQCQ